MSEEYWKDYARRVAEENLRLRKVMRSAKEDCAPGSRVYKQLDRALCKTHKASESEYEKCGCNGPYGPDRLCESCEGSGILSIGVFD